MTAPAIPQTVAEFEEALNDGARVQEMVLNNTFGEFTKNYAKKLHEKDHGEIVAQFKEQLQAGLRDFMISAEQDFSKLDLAAEVRKARANRPTGLLGHDKGQVHNPKAPGAILDGEFSDVQDYFHTIWGRKNQLPNWQELERKENKLREILNAASSTVPSDGGFLIPEILRSEILELALESSVVRQRATVIPMDSLKVPIPAVDETSRANSIYGGIIFYWTAEGAAGIDASAKFGQVTLDAKKLMGYAGIPNELMKDSAAFRGWFASRFPRGYGWFEDIAYLTGDGTDKPLGCFNGAGTVSVSRNTSNQVLYTDLVGMYARMYPASHESAVWLCSPDVLPQLMQLSFTPSGGSNPVPVMLWQPNAQAAPSLTILGRPLIVTEKIGPLGSTGDVAYVDFSEYLIGDRQAMTMESSADYLFGTDKTAFRVIGRVDGRPWVQSAITPRNGASSTLSPYVALHS
ncbi:MAG TPA: phage major capsid protein [Mycobacterium sp.]|nr:phage major capsid protein [Mycobacterium sp.]